MTRVLVVLAAVALCPVGVAPQARADEGQYTEFYVPPDPLPPGAPGDLIRAEPDADHPWTGSGPRPLISYAVGTYGMGEQCAPSRLFNQGIHFSSGLDVTVG